MLDVTPHNPDPNATARVLNPLPPITFCTYCRSSVKVCTNDEVYGRTFGEYPWIYLCENEECNSYVGLHPLTDIPLGTLADGKTRKARKEVKAIFETWYKTRRIARSQAYQMLANAMGLQKEECHFGWFDIEACYHAKKALGNLTKRRVK